MHLISGWLYRASLRDYMSENTKNDVRSGDESKSIYETLEADVLEESKHRPNARTSDVAVTAEFDYIDDWDDDSEASESSGDEPPKHKNEAAKAGINRGGRKSKKPNGSQGPITRALNDFDLSLDEDDEDDQPPSGPEIASLDPNLSSSAFDRRDGSGAAWGFDQPQVSGVFSRYEEETGDNSSEDDFDLFDEDNGPKQRERTLQDIVSTHEKQIRLLEKRLAYQKEVIQVVSELLVEARVVSKRELKKRLRALRDKQS